MLMAYRHTDWFKPATEHAVSEVKSVISHVTPGGNKAEDQLTQARESYASGNVTAAVASYQEYLKNNPRDADATGELGNIFYAVGDMPSAGQAYFDAANILIDQNQTDQAGALLPVIGQINPNLAGALAGRLAQANQPQPPEGMGQAPAGIEQQAQGPQGFGSQAGPQY
jgi:tetratricopeptide (TPR) repeat protein